MKRFYEKVELIPESTCRWWAASTNGNGYGLFYLDGKMQKAHRVAWILANGPIPDGEGHHGTCVLHRCDNRLCVNPDHLFLGTMADNMDDMAKKGRSTKGERHPKAKLTEGQVLEIFHAEGLHREIAKNYGISRQQVGDIKLGKSWTHLTQEQGNEPKKPCG